MKSLKVLTTLLILTTFSGCSLFKEKLVEPLCLPSNPILESITVEEQLGIFDGAGEETLRKIAENDSKLKSWITTTKRITEAHNEQFESKCGDNS